MAEIREIKVAFNDYRADLTLDVGFEGNIPMDAPLLALPEVVNIDKETGMMSVAYGNMSGLLIEAIKELVNKVNELEKQLNELKK